MVLKGHPAGEIVKFSVDNGTDLIVMGSLGKSGVQRILLGSVAENVVRHSKCEVLIVH